MGYTLRRTLPVFLYLTRTLRKTRSDKAFDTFFNAYCAGKYGKECLSDFMKQRGSFFLETPESVYVATPEDYAAAVEQAVSVARSLHPEDEIKVRKEAVKVTESKKLDKNGKVL